MPGSRRFLQAPLARRLRRYASVSVVSSVTSFTVLGLLVWVGGLDPALANVVAVAVATVPSFELNRRWVWSLAGERPRLEQVVPFSVLSFSGLGLSTLAVALASSLTSSSGHLVRAVVAEGANFATYGVLWVAQFLLCDRVLFRTERVVDDRSPVGVGS